MATSSVEMIAVWKALMIVWPRIFFTELKVFDRCNLGKHHL